MNFLCPHLKLFMLQKKHLDMKSWFFFPLFLFHFHLGPCWHTYFSITGAPNMRFESSDLGPFVFVFIEDTSKESITKTLLVKYHCLLSTWFHLCM